MVFFNDTAPTEIYTLTLPDALPISRGAGLAQPGQVLRLVGHDGHQRLGTRPAPRDGVRRSEEHTSELQSRQYLVCRLLLEKKKICLSRAVMPICILQSLSYHAPLVP